LGRGEIKIHDGRFRAVGLGLVDHHDLVIGAGHGGEIQGAGHRDIAQLGDSVVGGVPHPGAAVEKGNQ